MKIFKFIKKNSKAILVIALIAFNIPLLLGLGLRVHAELSSEYTYPLNNPAQQSIFGITDKETTKVLTNGKCEAELSYGLFKGLTGFFEKIALDYSFQEAGCLYQGSDASSNSNNNNSNNSGSNNNGGGNSNATNTSNGISNGSGFNGGANLGGTGCSTAGQVRCSNYVKFVCDGSTFNSTNDTCCAVGETRCDGSLGKRVRCNDSGTGWITTNVSCPTSENSSNNSIYASTELREYFSERSGGLVNTVSNINATILEQRPLSAKTYIDQKVYALTNPGTVYASGGEAPAPYFPGGTGFQLLQPVQAFWGWSVNVVYGFLILIIIGIAFAIVFRNNIGGAQMVTIQSAIPSIALAMILVPLSYAISGVFIDAITVGTNAVHAFLLGPGAPGHVIYENRNPNRETGIGAADCVGKTLDDECDRGLYADDYRVDWFQVQKMVDISDEVSGVAGEVDIGGTTVNNFFVFDIVKRILDLFSGQNESAAYWFGEIINVFIGLTMIWIGIKIAWKLFQKYLMLILMPIISPFIFATAAVPGNGTKSIVEYLKMMASGSLFFIVTYAMFLLTILFTSSDFYNQLNIAQIQTGIFTPPLLGFKDVFNSTSQVGSMELTRFILMLIGLGIYFSIPKTLENIDAALGVKNAIPSFITTPFESFKESARITYKAAPAFGAKAVVATSKAAGGVTTAALTSRYRGKLLINKLQDKDPNDPGGATFNIREDFTRRRQKYLQARDNASTPIERARWDAELRKLDAQESMFGVSTKAEEGKERKITAKVEYSTETSSQRYAFTNEEIRRIEIHFETTPNKLFEIPLGRILIEAENFTLPGTVDITIGSPKKKDYTNLQGDKVTLSSEDFDAQNFDEMFPSPVHPGEWDIDTDIFLNKSWENIPVGVISKSILASLSPGTGFYVAAGNQTRNTDTKKTDIPLRFAIRNEKDFRTIFGSLDAKGANKNYIGGIIDKGIQTKKRMVRIGNMNTNSFRIAIGKYSR